MVVKAVLLFLVGMAVLAMFGRLRIPGAEAARRLGGARRCARCGRYRIGKGKCTCGHD